MNRLRFLVCLLALLAFSCSKIEESHIPYANVFMKLDLRYQDKELVTLLGYKQYTKPRYAGEQVGFSGVLVVHGYNGFYAFDLCCPHEATQSVKIIPTDVGTAKCPKCNSVYDTANGIGNPMEGPSQFQLRPYNIYESGQELIVRH